MGAAHHLQENGITTSTQVIQIYLVKWDGSESLSKSFAVNIFVYCTQSSQTKHCNTLFFCKLIIYYNIIVVLHIIVFVLKILSQDCFTSNGPI